MFYISTLNCLQNTHTDIVCLLCYCFWNDINKTNVNIVKTQNVSQIFINILPYSVGLWLGRCKKDWKLFTNVWCGILTKTRIRNTVRLKAVFKGPKAFSHIRGETHTSYLKNQQFPRFVWNLKTARIWGRGHFVRKKKLIISRPFVCSTLRYFWECTHTQRLALNYNAYEYEALNSVEESLGSKFHFNKLSYTSPRRSINIVSIFIRTVRSRRQCVSTKKRRDGEWKHSELVRWTKKYTRR